MNMNRGKSEKVKSIKKSGLVLALMISVMSLNACGKTRIPDKWYDATLDYYKEGFETGWKNEEPSLYISDEMKDKKNHFGYLLKDLDGDGADELLIGIIDDSTETKFTDVYIWHRDVGAFRILNGGEGYYIYLCGGVVRVDSWYGSETKTEYMKYDSENNSFLHITSDEPVHPGKYELTPFD